MIRCTVLLLILFCFAWLNAEVLNIPDVHQEQDQWCWAGCSKAILDYYGFSFTQSQIAQFGTNGDNTWNWLYGESSNPTRKGIDLILYHFGSLVTQSYVRTISIQEIEMLISTGRPFVIRWGWNTGGGHFIVGKGSSGEIIYAMDPWYGSETISSYNWFCSGDGHYWTHTLNLITEPSEDIESSESPVETLNLFASNCSENRSIEINFSLPKESFSKIDIFNMKGQKVTTLCSKVFSRGENSVKWNAENKASGVYFCRLQTDSLTEVRKFLLLN